MRKHLIFLFLFPFSSLLAQSTDSISLPSIFDFFSENKVFEITLEAEFDSIVNSKKFGNYLKGKIFFTDKNDVQKYCSIKVKQRGKYRRKVCDFPPLRLKFEKEMLNSMNLNPNFNKLKLVSHCLNDNYKSKENILREYLAYKFFEFHSEKHFRVHLVKIKYRYLPEKYIRFERYGILLEEENNLAHRMNGKISNSLHCTINKIKTEDLQINAMYQYMIGNSDWDPVKVRNIKLIQKDSLDLLDIVPYDFDFSGLVNTSYAVPNPNFKLKNTRDRVMISKFKSEEELKNTATFFLNKKETVMEFCKNFTVLSKASRRDIKKYLSEFYEILEDEELMKSAFLIQEKSSTSN